MTEIFQTITLAIIAASLVVLAFRASVHVHVSHEPKVILPHDISSIAQDIAARNHRIDIGHRQPNGTYQPVGHVDVADPANEATWPERLRMELATEGRAIRIPGSAEWREG